MTALCARRLAAAAVVGLTAAAAVAVGAGPAAAATATGSYVAVSPHRLLDTRSAVGVPTRTPVGGHRTVTFRVAGTGSAVPLGASAVALNVTATGAAASGYVTAYAADASRPAASTLNFAAGQTVPNLVLAPVSAAGSVSLYNGSAGSVHLLADVSGYYTGGTPGSTQQGAFGSVPPARVLDTRHSIGVPTTTAVPARATVSFTAEGIDGVPADVAGVALNITATGATASGYLTAYASDSSRPGTSNVNYVAGRTLATLTITRTGGDHRVTIYNGSAGTVHVIADVQGYYTAGDPVVAGDTGALPPARVLAATTVQAGQSVGLVLAGRGGIPLAGAATAFLGVTVTKPQRGGYLTVYQGSTRPAVSNLNFAAGETVANLVAAPSGSGTIRLYNGSSGTVEVLADVSAYVIGADLPLPGTSTGHYVRTISSAPGRFADPSASGVGCTDAHNGDTFVLLDIGAQANDKTGVVLSATSTKITYPALVSAVNDYVSSYRACSPSAVTIAVGTNNEGDFTAYTAAQRGADWADKVVDQIAAPTVVTIEGANDIEASFSSTEAQAQQWETAFLGSTAAALVYNGSADGCPDAYGAAAATGSYGWTPANYYSLTHSGARIEALPQIYVALQARQWANIDRFSGGGIAFRGSLTEHAVGCGDPCGMSAPQGWAFLYHALSTVVASPNLAVAADLDVLT